MVCMPAVIDHVFLCTPRGAPGAERLAGIGLLEGSPNRHPGQGTACRRFYFQNAMLELLWVEDASEAQLEQNRRLDLWRRWSEAGRHYSPFGIILRPAAGTGAQCPFPSWDYRPVGMPELQLKIADGTDSMEPLWGYLPSGRPPAEAPPGRRQPLEHAAGLAQLTGVHLAGPLPACAAVTHSMEQAGLLTLEASPSHRLELHFDHRGQSKQADLRPEFPIVLRW